MLTEKIIKARSEFWLKKDPISMARSLRLAVIQSQFNIDNLTEGQARKLLSGPLSPDNDSTIYNDANCLDLDHSDGVNPINRNERTI